MSLRSFVLLACMSLVSCAKPDEDRLVQAAIEYSYPGIYASLSDLQQDYPRFEPRVRRWSSRSAFLFGMGRYAVRLPEEEVLVTGDARVKGARPCGSQDADCTLAIPKEPQLGIVGTVQLGAPDYAPVEALRVAWKGSPGYVVVVGNCFAAYKSSAEPLELTLTVPGHDPIVIGKGYGFRLVAVTADSTRNYYGTGRIPESTFLESRTCSEAARTKWPNVGGWAWKR